jgi:hypothetical protein
MTNEFVQTVVLCDGQYKIYPLTAATLRYSLKMRPHMLKTENDCYLAQDSGEDLSLAGAAPECKISGKI